MKKKTKTCAEPALLKALQTLIPKDEKTFHNTEKSTCNGKTVDVDLISTLGLPAITPGIDQRIGHMTLTLKGLSKSGKVAIYTGLAVAIRIATTAFPNKVPPPSFDVSGAEFAEKAVKVPRVKETAEARKARLAALPKLTAAEKVARLEAKLAKARAKLAPEAPAVQEPVPA